MITYRAVLGVPRELVREVAKLLRAERHARGTRTGSRALTCWYQALLVLAWFRTKGEIEIIGAGFGASRATAYRDRDAVVQVLAAQAPDLHEARREVAAQGWSHMVLDGKVVHSGRCAETTVNTKRKPIHSWHSGKHHAFGRQRAGHPATGRSVGLGLRRAPGRCHDLAVARDAGVLGALNWAASRLGLPTLAAAGYEGAGRASKCRSSSPAAGRSWLRTTRPTTRCTGPPAPVANAASRSSSAVGEPFNGSPPARAESAPSSTPRSFPPTSNTPHYALLAEITSVPRGSPT
ncbi:hypothetical protein [Pseudonocardia asaccharolytica]|uniref:Transposase Helix-turn-helix domain-containing protein n=1 Tax=Pseudonocardia asaccharolytica DSM 44247 = NBRC 16224 TaxID=1123024 RepID=A0A511DB85_9PSEU|nr:hypothetical protein [Pseudonocardia asaccharolytica]GEL20208.1 hypothetical protein PA7_40450 [Pseudonocardia asaccharolytica DSM 44247 = NBRC 16224]